MSGSGFQLSPPTWPAARIIRSARALYLGDTLYRIHGTNEPLEARRRRVVGCIRMSNDDIVDLYNRAKIGATVIVQR